VNPVSQLEARIQRWIDAGLIDAQAGARIVAFEAGQERTTNLQEKANGQRKTG
jgi:hypothetical protein